MDAQRNGPTSKQALVFRLLIGVLAVGIAAIIISGLSKYVPTDVAGETTYEPYVQVIGVEEVNQTRQWRGYGTIKAIRESDVPARVSAIVNSRAKGLRSGAAIKEGDLILELDDSDVKKQIDLASAQHDELAVQQKQLDLEEKQLKDAENLQKNNVDLAKRELDRFNQVQGSVSPLEKISAESRWVRAKLELSQTTDAIAQLPVRRERIEAQVKAANATLQMRKLDLDRCTVHSPINGTLQIVDVEPGEQVVPGQRVARIVDLSQVEVTMHLPASSRAEIAAGSPVVITRSGSDFVWEATVERIAPEDDPDARTVSVYASVTQTPGQTRELLVPGAFVNVEVSGQRSHRRLVIPRRSIRDDRVRVIRDGRVTSADVKVDFTVNVKRPSTGILDDQWVVLAEKQEQLSSDDQILLNFAAKVRDGQRVKPKRVDESNNEGD